MRLSVHRRELEAVRAAAMKCGCDMRVLNGGTVHRWGGILKRRILPAVLLLAFVSVLFASKFYVWDIAVVGNDKVATGKILDVLAECGVRSGKFWPDFSADNIRNEVLLRMPELSWISVNMHGSLAEVIVVERQAAPEMRNEKAYSDIVSRFDAYVSYIDVLSGQAAVKKGDAVTRGQLLVSGRVESSLATSELTEALGYIKGEINCILNAVYPENVAEREYKGRSKEKYSLIIGNKRINLYSGSSISGMNCDKINSVWWFEVPDLFSLPLGISVSREFEYDAIPSNPERERCKAVLNETLTAAFENMAGDAEILSSKLSYGSDGAFSACLRVRCICDIGESTGDINPPS